ISTGSEPSKFPSEDYLRIFGFRFVACAVVCFAATGVHAQTAQVTAIRAGRLFDSKSGKIAENQVILVEEEKITAVGPADRVQIPAGAQVIDLSKGTVLPGLIDGHTHVFGYGLDDIKPGGPPFASPINDTREYRTLLALANAQKDLRAGFTSLRDLMSHGGGYADVDIKKAINRGFFQGPRMQVSTMGLVATGEGILGSPEVNLPRNYQTVDGPWAARQAVREQIHYGADWIKFHSTADYEFESDGELWSEATFTDRKSTRLNSSHTVISYAVFCLKKKKDITCKTVKA